MIARLNEEIIIGEDNSPSIVPEIILRKVDRKETVSNTKELIRTGAYNVKRKSSNKHKDEDCVYTFSSDASVDACCR